MPGAFVDVSCSLHAHGIVHSNTLRRTTASSALLAGEHSQQDSACLVAEWWPSGTVEPSRRQLRCWAHRDRPPLYEHNDFTFALTCLSSVSPVGIVGGGDQACEFEAGRTMIRFSCCRSSALKWDLRQSPPTFCFIIRLHDDFALSPTAL